jgi:hypothetical protein
MSKTAVATQAKAAVRQRTKEAPPEDNFERAKKCLETIGESWYEFDQRVADIYDNEEYKAKYGEDAKWDAVAKSEWGMAYRTAMTHVQVGQTIKKFGLSKEALHAFGISWTNFYEVSTTFTPDMTRAQIESRIKKAAKMTHDEVVKFRQEIKTGVEGGHPVTLVTMTFKLKNEAGKVVQEALAMAKELMDVPFDDAALEYMCLDWMQEHDPDKVDKIKKQLKSDLSEEEEAKPKGERKERADKGKAKGKKAATPKAKKAKEEPEGDDADDDLLGA